MAGLIRACGTAAVPSTSMFWKLPSELIVLIMCHTPSSDLANLIRTDRFMNGVFNTHKARIFKRIQAYQFPEFLEWFGDLPGFDGPIPGNNRSFQQIRCLQGVVLSLHWRHVVPIPCDNIPRCTLLQLLERYGGWRYLDFLNVLKHYVEQGAQKLYRKLHEEIPVMDGRLAKSMVLCFFSMSLDAAMVEEGESEELAFTPASVEDGFMPARVKNGLKWFRKEPHTLQKLMIKALRFLIFRIANRLQLEDVATSSRLWYLAGEFRLLTPVQTEEDFDDLSSQVLAKTLLQAFFFYGVGMALQLCEEPACREVRLAQSLIESHFESNLQDQLDATISGVAIEIDPTIREGSLWAAGIGFPTFGWIVTDQE